jgi:DNA polymerase III epsilon subunit-like protein
MYLVIDCETTGLPKSWKAPPSDVDNWPRTIQIAWSLFDISGSPIESAAPLIQPEGFTIPAEVQRIHGISTERAMAEGKKLAVVLEELTAASAKSEIVIAHNIGFDEAVISAEYHRLKIRPPFSNKKRICTMKGSVEFCKIPGQYGYKWPTLSQLHQVLFDSGFEEAHDAGADVSACARCFFELKKRKVIFI